MIFLMAGTQKCLSAMPGISPVSFNERALTKVKNRKTPVTSWFLDVQKINSSKHNTFIINI
jgi:alanine-glyoxylate transaminase/serine-glyoxylate transaminase/serine-pyruvate transaminase